jgi:drug/metabolite transporter (DMT)-like permease
VVAAVVASSLFSVGIVLQASETRGVDPRFSLRLSLIRHLIARRRWVVGTAVTLAGYPFHIAALLLAPLTVVQPALAAGLLLLLVVGARTHEETIGPRDVVGVVAIVVGVVAMTLTAPRRSEVDASTGPLLVALAGLVVITLTPYVLTRLRGVGAGSLATLATFAAGAAYAFDGISTKLVSDHLSADELAAAIGWLAATLVVGGLGFLGQITALQRHTAAQVGPVIYVVPVLVPVLLSPFLTGEDWGATPLGGGVLVASLLIVSVGAGLVSASSSVGRATEREGASPSRPAPS